MFKKIFSILILSLSLSTYAAEIPVDAKLDYNQGIDFYKLGMYDKAIASFRSAISTYPDYIDAYYNLGTVLEYTGQYSQALLTYKQVYVRNPNDYEVIYKMAMLSSKLEDYDKSNEYIKIIPQTSEYYTKGQDLAQSFKSKLLLPEPEINKPSKIAEYSGIYENILSPTGITTDKDGNLYVATYSDNTIIKITPEGKRLIFFKNPLVNGPISLASDGIGNIYVSNYNTNNVLKITPTGEATIIVSKIDKPYGLHVEGNMLFITCQGSNSILRQKI